MFSLIVPTLLGIAINAAYPVPSWVQMINSLRAIQAGASEAYDASKAGYQDEHFAMAAGTGVLNRKDLGAARKRVLVQQAAVLTEDLMEQHNEQLTRQQQTADWLRFLSPAIVMQEALNDCGWNRK